MTDFPLVEWPSTQYCMVCPYGILNLHVERPMCYVCTRGRLINDSAIPADCPRREGVKRVTTGKEALHDAQRRE
jgi:hypothetical protein